MLNKCFYNALIASIGDTFTSVVLMKYFMEHCKKQNTFVANY